MASSKRVYIRYFTKDKLALINEKSLKVYEKYRRARISKDKNVAETTYKTYQNYFNQFLVFLSEEYDNMYILSDDFQDESVEILEDFIVFCQDKLGNNKKVINTKLSAVSSFFLWAVKRGMIDAHPFDRKLERMRGAKDEKLIGNHFLNDEQIAQITSKVEIECNKQGGIFDIQDVLIWRIALDSGCRLGALTRLDIESLDMESMSFVDIREKRGKITDIPFVKSTGTYITKWLMEREERGIDCEGLFAVRYDGEWKAMSGTSIYKRVKKMGNIIGLDDFRPHCIRKTAVNRIVEKTGDLTMAQGFAGHESPETTAGHYVKPKSKAEIRDKLSKIMNTED